MKVWVKQKTRPCCCKSEWWPEKGRKRADIEYNTPVCVLVRIAVAYWPVRFLHCLCEERQEFLIYYRINSKQYFGEGQAVLDVSET